MQNNPFLQSSPLCQRMRAAGDYDILSKRRVVMPDDPNRRSHSLSTFSIADESWETAFDVTRLVLQSFRNSWTWSLVLYFCFLGCFCLPVSWSMMLKLVRFVLRFTLYLVVFVAVAIYIQPRNSTPLGALCWTLYLAVSVCEGIWTTHSCRILYLYSRR